MWKFVSRRIRDTFEKSLNHFEKRSSAGVVNTTNGSCDDKKRTSSPCLWFCPKTCWSSKKNNNDTNNRGWSENINRNWMGAITWSSVLVLGWYANHIINLAHKYHRKERKTRTTLNNLIITLCPYANGVNKEALDINTNSRIENIINTLVPTVHLVANESIGKNENSGSSSDATTSSGTSSSDLGDVLNSIENKLGLAAIEKGQHEDGLNLLRSAATRRHAPALYNLGLCYEMGLGVTVDEKIAMEFYRSAAALEHPGALYNLGIYYGQGRGGLQHNLETATRLLRLAAVQGQQDAIEALKTLNMEIMEPSIDNKTKMWAFSHNDNIVPTHSTLFVDNVNFFNAQTDKSVLI